MDVEMYLCISQNEVKTPYKFNITNIKVYSIEEAAYHCFTYWKQSYDEFLSKEFLEWVRNLELLLLANKILALKEKNSITDRLLGFLSLFQHFDNVQMAKLKTNLISWEETNEWERLKDRADFLANAYQMEKALFLYTKAISLERNFTLLNNIGVCYMKLANFKEATNYLEEAHALEKDNVNIILNLAEAHICNRNFEKAIDMITQAEHNELDNPNIKYLIGELNMETGNTVYAVGYFLEALDLKYDEHFIFRLYDAYMKLRKYDEALEVLERLNEKNRNYLIKKAEVYILIDNFMSARNVIENALENNRNDVLLWVMLAKCFRLDYNLNMAENTIIKALSLDNENKMVKYEYALIHKSKGSLKEYQDMLSDILISFKNKYRYDIIENIVSV